MVSIIRYNINDIMSDKYVDDMRFIRFDMYVKIPLLGKSFFSNDHRIEILHSFGETDDHNILALNIGFVNKTTGKIFGNYKIHRIVFYDRKIGCFIKSSYGSKFLLCKQKFPMLLNDDDFLISYYKKFNNI